MELGLGFAEDLPIAHIAVIRAVNLANGLLFDGDALHSLDGDHSRHTDGVARLDLLAQRLAVDVLIQDAGDVLLGNALDGETQLVADSLGGVPGVGRLKVGGVSDLRFKFLRRQAAAVGFCQGDAVLFHVVAVGSLDLGDVVTACRHDAHHVDPEDVLHAAAGDGTAIFLGQLVQLVDHGCGGRPGVDGLLAGGDDIDATGHALLDGLVNVADEAAGGDDGHIGIALVQNLLCIVRDEDTGLDAQLSPIPDVLADGRTVADAADNLCAMLVGITQGVLAHFAATILHDFDLIHSNSSFLNAYSEFLYF